MPYTHEKISNTIEDKNTLKSRTYFHCGPQHKTSGQGKKHDMSTAGGQIGVYFEKVKSSVRVVGMEITVLERFQQADVYLPLLLVKMSMFTNALLGHHMP